MNSKSKVVELIEVEDTNINSEVFSEIYDIRWGFTDLEGHAIEIYFLKKNAQNLIKDMKEWGDDQSAHDKRFISEMTEEIEKLKFLEADGVEMIRF